MRAQLKRINSKSKRRFTDETNNDFDISNNAFASAILDDDSDASSGLRDEIFESIVSHDVAVQHESESHRRGPYAIQGSSQRRDSFSQKQNMSMNSIQEEFENLDQVNVGIDDEDDFSFRPPPGHTSLPHHNQLNKRNKSDHLVANRRQSFNSFDYADDDDQEEGDGDNYDDKPKQEVKKKMMMIPNRPSLSSVRSITGSIISSGISSVKVQVSELDKMLLQRRESERFPTSGTYEVPLPTMPFETRKAMYLRVFVGLLCFSMALVTTIFYGEGQLGHASASLLYRNIILQGASDIDNQNQILNNGNTIDGAHLFEKVKTLEKGFKANVNGDPGTHIPIVNLMNQGMIEITVGNEMEYEDYVQFMWVKDVNKKEVVLAKNFSPDNNAAPVLKAQVPSGAVLQPFLFFNINELWVGEPFQVP